MKPLFMKMNRLNSLALGLCLLAGAYSAPAAKPNFETEVNDLIPKIAAAKVEDRYDAQIALQTLAAKAARPKAESERAALATLLAKKAADASVPQPARVWIVRQLEHIGSAESLATLEALLKDQDAELKETARRALEKNSSSKASDVLRKALKEGGDIVWQIGLVRSLGQRKDEDSVALIASKLEDSKLAPVAALALGTIANDDAIKALSAALDKKITGAGDGLVLAGRLLLNQGKTKPALKAIQKAYDSGESPVKGIALHLLAKAAPGAAEKQVLDAISSSDERLQRAAISAIQEVYGTKLTTALTGLLPKLNPTAKSQVLRLLDATAETQVIVAASDSDETVRIAALEALAKIGSSAAVPVLLKAYGETADTDKKAAEWSLTRISGPGALAALKKQAGEGDAKLRAAAIGALALQFDKTAFPVILKYAAESDATVSKAAYAALKKVGTDNEIEGLGKLAISSKISAASEALQAITGRTADKAGALKKLSALAAAADAKGKAAFLEVLTGMGGNEAMQAVIKDLANTDADVKDGAIRALSKWPDFAAINKLEEIAADSSLKLTYNVLAVQGIVRLVESCDKEKAQARIDAIEKALQLAKRPDEKKRALSGLAGVADKKSVAVFKKLMMNEDLKEDVAMAAVTLANNLKKPDKKAGKDMAEFVKKANVSPAVNKKADGALKNLEAK